MTALAMFLIGIVVGVAVAMVCLHAVLAMADQRTAVQMKRDYWRLEDES